MPLGELLDGTAALGGRGQLLGALGHPYLGQGGELAGVWSSMSWRRNSLIRGQRARAASASGLVPGTYAPISTSSRTSRCAAISRRSCCASLRCSGVVTAPDTLDIDSRTSIEGKWPDEARR